MRISQSLLCATLLLASTSVAQSLVGVPPHGSVYTGFTRGYQFISATNFNITQLELPTDAFMAGDTASYMIIVNGVERLRQVGVAPGTNGAGTLATTLIINNGDDVTVLGNWSPATTTNFTANNSYGTVAAPFATTIEGVPHTLNRSGWQWDISDPGYTGAAVLAPTTGSIGRVLMYTTPAIGLFPGFNADVTAGFAPLTVNFSDSSYTSDPAGILAWQWDFDGDGTIDSALQNPTHTYTTRGVYDVTLNVIDSNVGLATLTKTAYIDVTLAAPTLNAVAEITPGAGTLSAQSPQAFSDSWDIRWNLLDTTGTQTGMFGAVVANFSIGSSAPVGVTGSIPGFNQLWGGSTPIGVAEVLGPFLVGGADVAVTIPAGLFMPGDTVRFQGLMLDPQASGPGLLPVLPSLETIEFRHRACAGGFEDFDSLGTGVGIYPAGWSNGGGGAEWSVIGGPTTSAATGPAAAVSGANYMYCETSAPVAGRTFIMNTGVIPTGGLNGTLNFELSRVGATIGTLEIRQDDGSGTFPILLATYTGADPTGADWTNESVNLQLAGLSTVQLQFNYAQGASFTGDLGIDDVCIN